jgi:hypothetical protein
LDTTVGRFLNWVRPRARSAHLAAYEDLAVALDDFLRRRRGRRPLHSSEVGPLVGAWYRGPGGRTETISLRHFCAALRVFARWNAREAVTPDSKRLRAQAASAARDTRRASRVSELLERTVSRQVPPPDTVLCDGYWQVVLLGESHAVLREVGTAEPIGPVHLPAAVVRELRPGSILNLCIAADGQRWRVVQHGLCYPAVALGALRAQAVPGPA